MKVFKIKNISVASDLELEILLNSVDWQARHIISIMLAKCTDRCNYYKIIYTENDLTEE